MTTIYIVATGASSQAKPSDISSTNTFEVVGGGGGGASGTAINNAACGGGGGGYSKLTNFSTGLMAGTFFFSVGTGGTGATTGDGAGTSGADSWCQLALGSNTPPGSTAAGALAKAGGGAPNTANPGAGGAAASGIGTVTNSGGSGGANVNNAYGSSGGGGSGGPQGNGGAGGAAATGNDGGAGGGGSGGGGSGTVGAAGSANGSVNGGAGGNNAAGTGTVGTAGTGGATPTVGGIGTLGAGGGGGGGTTSAVASKDGGAGGPGQDWDSTHGVGGGGGGGGGHHNATVGTVGAGGVGGLYGGGGGGGGSTAATGATGNGGNGAQGIVVIIYTPAGGATVTIGWSRPSDSDRPPRLTRENIDVARQWFLPSPNPVPAGWLPITGESRQRDPLPVRRPDEPTPFFVQSPNPVPTQCPPRTNQWDRQPRLPNDSDKYTVTWQARIPPAAAGVGISGIAWYISKEENRPPPPPDQYVVTWNPPQSPLQSFMAQTNADDFNPLKTAFQGDGVSGWVPKVPAPSVTISGIAWWRPYIDVKQPIQLPTYRRPYFTQSPNPVPTTWLPQPYDQPPYPPKPDQYRTSWAPQFFAAVNTISGIAWWRPHTDVKPPISRPPDEAFPWFVQSPNPVPTSWLPQPYDQPPFPAKYDQYRIAWIPQTFIPQSTIAGIAWWRPYADVRPPIQRSPDEAFPYFTQSPNPVPVTWLPQPYDQSPYPPRSDQHITSWAPRTVVAVSTIAGMAWHISKEEMRPPRPPLNPDEFRRWFVRSPVPVLQTWLPQTGKDVERLPALGVISDRYVVTWNPFLPPPSPPPSLVARLRTLVGTGL